MIYDFTDVILQYASTYQKITTETFEYGGITYKSQPVTSQIRGIFQPLKSEDRKSLLDLGYTISGKKNLYIPTSEGKLTEQDIIVDSDGVEWVVLPISSDYSELAGYIKYTLDRKVV